MTPRFPTKTFAYIAAGLASLGGFWYHDSLHNLRTPDRQPHYLGTQISSPVDVVVIGGSHAGLSAAATLYRHQHSMLIFDDGKPRNRWKTVTRVISGGEGLDPEKLVRKARREIAVTGFATTLNRTIVTVRRQNNSLFEVTDTFGETWYGRKLLLATGAQFFFPEIPGYEENFPNKM
jgi:thioredoxin reductase